MFVHVVFTIALFVMQAPGTAPQAQPAPEQTESRTKLTVSDISHLQAKAEGGDAAAQLALGVAYDEGNGVLQSDALAAKWFRKAADQGNAEAQNALGVMYRVGLGVERNKEEALKWYRKAARQKNANAMFNLGAAYYNGDGVAIDDSAAYAWFLLAREGGSKNAGDAVSRAESELRPWAIDDGLKKIAVMYDKGDELPQDLRESAKWYQKAAERGDPEAQIATATVLLNGKGIPQDYGGARHWCEQAAKHGYDSGRYCLGYIYQRGLGVPRDPKEASKWYDQAARRGNGPAAKALAQIYATGEAGKVDRPAAFLLYLGPLTAGHKDALREAAKLKAQMNQKEWEKVQKQLRYYLTPCRGGDICSIDPKKLDAALQQAGTQ